MTHGMHHAIRKTVTILPSARSDVALASMQTAQVAFYGFK